MFKKERGYASRSFNSTIIWQWRGWPYFSIQKITVSDRTEEVLRFYGFKIYGLGLYYRWNKES